MVPDSILRGASAALELGLSLRWIYRENILLRNLHLSKLILRWDYQKPCAPSRFSMTDRLFGSSYGQGGCALVTLPQYSIRMTVNLVLGIVLVLSGGSATTRDCVHAPQ